MALVLGLVRAKIARTSYALRCDINALCEIEAGMGCDIAEALRRYDARELRLSDERLILFALLQSGGGDFSIEAAGDLMSRDITGARRAIEIAIRAALPEADPSKKSIAAKLAAWISSVWPWLGLRLGLSRDRSRA